MASAYSGGLPLSKGHFMAFEFLNDAPESSKYKWTTAALPSKGKLLKLV